MKKLLAAALFYGCVSFVAFAQQTISGVVVSAEDRQPLAGATVRMQNQTRGTITDAFGRFTLRTEKAEAVTLDVTFVGFTKNTQVVTPGQKVTITLQPDLQLQEAVIVYAPKAVPFTKTEIGKAQLRKQNIGQDLPILLNFTPSVVTTSDAGAGIGYTGMRIRGSDATRTNVTVNGIPLNDAESHGVFWVNMPDFASSVQNITIQRGVGTSVNGAGAFGASVNIETEQASDVAYAETNNSVGSFGTLKNNILINTGLLNNKFKVYGRLSRVLSDGYIERANADLRSFYLSGSYADRRVGELTVNIFSGREITHQAWNGVSEQKIREGNRRYNELGGYDNEIDHYQQDHYQLLYNKTFTKRWQLNTALHYTRGRGFFEQYRQEDELQKYGLADVIVGGDTVKNSDLIRRRWLNNYFYGLVYSLRYQTEAQKNNIPVLDLTLGGGYNHYIGHHFGEVIWARFMSNGSIRQRYYNNDANKTDFNAYAKATWQIMPGFFAYTDLQIRAVSYTFLGYDNQLNNVTQTDNLLFFNPKAGLRYQLGNRSTLYGSFAIGNKEPNRDDYTQSSPGSRPKHENLQNFEAGYQLQTARVAFTGNIYYMHYRNQLILTGQINDVGAYVRSNVARSYRAGIELQGKIVLGSKWAIDANATFSRNRIAKFTEYLDNYDNGSQQVNSHQNTHIAFSPSVIAAGQLVFTPKTGLEIGVLNKYVSRQYLDNTQTESRSIAAFFTNDLRLAYTFSSATFKELNLTLLVNNLFNHMYAANGYTYGYISGGETVRQNYYYPQAGTNYLLGLRIRL